MLEKNEMMQISGPDEVTAIAGSVENYISQVRTSKLPKLKKSRLLVALGEMNYMSKKPRPDHTT